MRDDSSENGRAVAARSLLLAQWNVAVAHAAMLVAKEAYSPDVLRLQRALRSALPLRISRAAASFDRVEL